MQTRQVPTPRRRAGRTLAAILAATAPIAAAVPAAADPAITTQAGIDFSVRPLPCADDPGYFAVTVTYNATSRASGDGRQHHLTQTGTFEAVPVHVTRFDDVAGDDHDHPVPVAWESRFASRYDGRITATSTSTNGGSTASFHVRLHAWGSGGERFSLQYVSHSTETPHNALRGVVEKGRCE